MDLPDAEASEPSLSARLDDETQASALASALLELPDYMREVVVLRCSRELSFAEIAEATGSPQGTLKSRFHRAVLALRDRLGRGERSRAMTPPLARRPPRAALRRGARRTSARRSSRT